MLYRVLHQSAIQVLYPVQGRVRHQVPQWVPRRVRLPVSLAMHPSTGTEMSACAAVPSTQACQLERCAPASAAPSASPKLKLCTGPSLGITGWSAVTENGAPSTTMELPHRYVAVLASSTAHHPSATVALSGAQPGGIAVTCCYASESCDTEIYCQVLVSAGAVQELPKCCGVPRQSTLPLLIPARRAAAQARCLLVFKREEAYPRSSAPIERCQTSPIRLCASPSPSSFFECCTQFKTDTVPTVRAKYVAGAPPALHRRRGTKASAAPKYSQAMTYPRALHQPRTPEAHRLASSSVPRSAQLAYRVLCRFKWIGRQVMPMSCPPGRYRCQRASSGTSSDAASSVALRYQQPKHSELRLIDALRKRNKR
jgi:hypothetical protein